MFRTFDGYKNLLGKVHSTAKLMMDVSNELFCHIGTLSAAFLGRKIDEGTAKDRVLPGYSPLSNGEINRIVRSAKYRRNKQFSYFNSSDGSILPLAAN